MKPITYAALAALIATAPLAIREARAADISGSEAVQSTTEDIASIIEYTMRAIKAAKKPLPAWAIDMALGAYRTYKTYKNGEKVEEVQREVLAVLKVVAEIKDQVEAGSRMTDREFRLTRELLDAHSRRLDDLADRLDVIEPRVDATEAAITAQIAKMKAWTWFNRVCKQTEHVWRPRQGKCVHVSVAGPRR